MNFLFLLCNFLSIFCGILEAKNPKHYNSPEDTRGLINYPNYYFIETGIRLGDGILEAVNAKVFHTCYFLDIKESYCAEARIQFANNPHINIIQGDSGVKLKTILDKIDLPATIRLDARGISANSAKADCKSGLTAQIDPLFSELQQIKNHPIKTHTILINAVIYLCMMYPEVYTTSTIEDAIYSINPNYIIEYINGGNGYIDTESSTLLAYIP